MNNPWVDKLEKRLAELVEQNKALLDENWRLAEERDQLLQQLNEEQVAIEVVRKAINEKS